jgi:hypothetical protein
MPQRIYGKSEIATIVCHYQNSGLSCPWSPDRGAALAADRGRSRLTLFGADSRVGQSIEWSEPPVPWICGLSR